VHLLSEPCKFSFCHEGNCCWTTCHSHDWDVGAMLDSLWTPVHYAISIYSTSPLSSVFLAVPYVHTTCKE
jgi:hypothetical protein